MTTLQHAPYTHCYKRKAQGFNWERILIRHPHCDLQSAQLNLSRACPRTPLPRETTGGGGERTRQPSPTEGLRAERKAGVGNGRAAPWAAAL